MLLMQTPKGPLKTCNLSCGPENLENGSKMVICVSFHSVFFGIVWHFTWHSQNTLKLPLGVKFVY